MRLGHVDPPKDVAEAMAMLTANTFITDTTLRVDGGHSAGHNFT